VSLCFKEQKLVLIFSIRAIKIVLVEKMRGYSFALGEHLRDEATLDDIMYELYMLQKVEVAASG